MPANIKKKPIGRPRVRMLAAVLACLFLAVPAGCGEGETTAPIVADYGDFGSLYARKLALDCPMRGAFTEEEKDAAEIIRTAFERLGLHPTVDVFTVTDEAGTVRSSQNVVVTLPGRGFTVADGTGGQTRTVRRQVVIGAHYDTWFSLPTVDEAGNPVAPAAGAGYDECVAARDQGFDGINDNASGVGVLLTLARELADETSGYDVVLVAFGAGNAGQAGARRYVSGMTAGEIAATDAMYCIEAVYAGDKLYASAGLNSVGTDGSGGTAKVYEKRRKLYEATDVAIENDLDEIGFDLLTNQSSLRMDLNADGVEDVYREVTLTASDHSPFDAAGIPCVYIESYNYAFDSLDKMKDTKNPEVSDLGGRIRNTPRDGYAYLESALTDVGRLERRINITAFILLKAVGKGYWEALP